MWCQVCDDSSGDYCENCADHDGDNCLSPPALIRAGGKLDVPVHRKEEPTPQKEVGLLEARDLIEEPISCESVQKIIDDYIDGPDHLEDTHKRTSCVTPVSPCLVSTNTDDRGTNL
jgi:hypothetical protein